MEENRKQKIIFTGGGTLGHITPLLSLYHFLWEEDYEYMWLGERDSFESEASHNNNIEFHDISAGKIRRYFDWRNFYEPLKNLTGIFESFYYIAKFKGDIVFSKGWHVAVPVCIAAFLLRKKIYIHESDSVMGLANKICSKLATKVFTSFPFENKKTIHCGHIMNPIMLDQVESIEREENERLQLLVIAWSQGSEKICEALVKISPDCSTIDFHILTGKVDNEELLEPLSRMVNVKLYSIISQKELSKLYINTDIAITRWSSTIWELMYFGIHSIIIPHKYTGGNHQQINAEYFHENYGSDVLDEDNNLELELFRRLKTYKDLRKTGLNLEGYLDGLKKIEEEIS